MKKILIINASNRKIGNSFALSKRFSEQLNGKAEITTFNISEKDVRPCLACDGCKRQHTPNCVQNDDFTALIPEIDSCDAMLILSPVHWDQFPAQLKAFLDRTYSFMDFTQSDLSMAGRKDKKLAGYFFSGFGPVDVYTNMVETNLKSFATAGFRDYKAHVAGDANVPGSIMDKPEDLKAADEITEWLLA
jgi:multimeric flavodoxin WrbA